MAVPSHLVGLAEDAFIRERIDPQQTDPYYLHLSDLLMALKAHATEDCIRVLDFGCGGSPYRSLFPNVEYFRADVAGAKNIDFQVHENSALSASDEMFDMVLSTQVLEHCPSPQTYLRESRRVLKSGGKLILSTHGLFEEHGCPYDFLRWTEDGLRMLLVQCGFNVDSIVRLTMGPRAGFMLLQSALSGIGVRDRPGFAGFLLRPLWRALLARRLWNPLLDSVFPEYRISGAKRLPGDSSYVALLAVARPQES